MAGGISTPAQLEQEPEPPLFERTASIPLCRLIPEIFFD